MFFVLFLFIGVACRNRNAWLILIPAGFIHLIWLIVKEVAGFGASEGEVFAQIFVPSYITVALLFAFAHNISRKTSVIYFLLALSIVALGGLASFFAYNFNGIDMRQSNQLAPTFNVIMGIAFLLGLKTAVLLSRKRYGWLKFAASLLAFSFLFTVAFILLYGLYDFGLSNLDIEVLVISLVFGFCLCFVAFPFLILVFCTPYYRRTLENVIPLRSTQTEFNGTDGESVT